MLVSNILLYVFPITLGLALLMSILILIYIIILLSLYSVSSIVNSNEPINKLTDCAFEESLKNFSKAH